MVLPTGNSVLEKVWVLKCSIMFTSLLWWIYETNRFLDLLKFAEMLILYGLMNVIGLKLIIIFSKTSAPAKQ